MSHRKISALVLATVGALAMTTVSIPASFAADAPDGAEHNDSTSDAAQSDPPASSGDVPLDASAQSEAPQEGGEENPTTSADSFPADDTPTTIIVQLREGSVGIPWYRRIFGLSSSTKHQEVKDRIEASVQAVVPGADVTDVRDYTRALDGFAIEAPASSLDAIKATEGVKAAFIERHHKPMVVEGDADTMAAQAVDPSLQNASSLEMTRANQTTQKGDKQVIEVIDTGIEATHQAFSGSMDGTDVRMTQADVEALAGTPPLGGNGTT